MAESKQSFLFSIFRRFSFKTFLIIMLIIMGWLFLNREKLIELWQSYEVRNRELSRVTKLEHQRRTLEKKRDLLERTTIETERLVREKFKMKRPGEKVIIIK